MIGRRVRRVARQAARHTLFVGGTLLVGTSLAATAPTKPPTAAAVLAELGDTMPRSFDIYPGDPCGGLWDLYNANGQTLMTIAVLRFRNLPLAHISGPQLHPVNEAVTRIDPHSILVRSGEMKIMLRCAGGRAVAELSTSERGQPVVLNARPGQPAASVATPQPQRQASVRVRRGNIQYVEADGGVHQVTDDGNYSEPVLSPDGHTVAFIHLDGSPTTEGQGGFTSLWVADALTGTTRRLLASRSNDEPSLNLSSFQNPRFSLDGGFIYVDAEAWATSAAVHQVSVATGKERFVIDGSVNGIIRTGKYRGYLLVGRHQYYPAPRSGSYNPVYVVRPDANEMFMVPGSDKDDGEHSQAAWLQSNGWTAW